jgi:hypothetical protein
MIIITGQKCIHFVEVSHWLTLQVDVCPSQNVFRLILLDLAMGSAAVPHGRGQSYGDP